MSNILFHLSNIEKNHVDHVGLKLQLQTEKAYLLTYYHSTMPPQINCSDQRKKIAFA